MTRYAEKTTTQVTTSQDEIRRTLKRYGASKTLFYHDDETGDGVVQFEMRGRMIRFMVDVPALETFRTDRNGYRRSPEDMKKARDQEERRRWRVLLLLLKGKLEVVADEAVPFDQEFLGNIVLRDRQTVGHHLIPRIQRAYAEDTMPDMLEDLLPAPDRILALPPPQEGQP